MTEKFQEIISWIKSTDIVEASLKEKGSGFSFSTIGATEEELNPLPPSIFQCVSAPTIGIFQWSTPGRSQKIKEGSLIASGDAIGLVETAPGKTTPVIAPVSGKIARILVEASSPVAYGQPILFIEPSGK